MISQKMTPTSSVGISDPIAFSQYSSIAPPDYVALRRRGYGRGGGPRMPAKPASAALPRPLRR
jgi:hypothetical protein